MLKTIKNDYSLLKNNFNKLAKEKKAEIVSCYEAGCTGLPLQRYLTENKIPCGIAAPSRIPRESGRRIKTDKKDAKSLATLLKNGGLSFIHIPSEEDEAVRDLIRYREDTRKSLQSSRQHLLGFLLRHNIIYNEGSHWTIKHNKFLTNLKFTDDNLRFVFARCYEETRLWTIRLKDIDKRIVDIATSSKYAERVNKLRSLKGIEYLTALSFIVEIGDFSRFQNAGQFMSFLGLVPGQRSSGNQIRMTGITKTGNSYLRRILSQAGQNYRFYSKDPKRQIAKNKDLDSNIREYSLKARLRLEKKFRKLINEGKDHQTAVIAVTRELSGFIWGLMTNNIAA